MLRAARFAAKLRFHIAEDSAAPIRELGELLRDVPPARLYDETLKLFQSGHATRSLEQLQEFDLLKYLFPHTAAALESERPGRSRNSFAKVWKTPTDACTPMSRSRPCFSMP